MDGQALRMPTFEEILDPSSPLRIIDLNLIRTICSRGVPNNPPWIRPRIWKLLLGTLSTHKDDWPAESTKSRQRYYDLATQFLEEAEQMSEPTLPLSARDKLLDTISKDVDRTQPKVPFFKSHVQPSRLSPLLPLPQDLEEVDEEPEEGEEKSLPSPPRIESATALFRRLELIRETTHRAKEKKPAIRPGSTSTGLPDVEESTEVPERRRPSVNTNVSATPVMTPVLSVTSPTSDSSHSVSILASHPLLVMPRHNQILLRILYLYSVVNPHQPYTQGLNELLAPLYFALCMEMDPREVAHAEADAFWLFTELIGEMGSVVGDPGDWQQPPAVEAKDAAPPSLGMHHGPMDGVKGAMKELSNRLRWADIQLWEDLAKKSLDPKLPYYSYRWIACILAQDLPLKALVTIWDCIFAQPPSTPDDNPRLSFLVDLCTSMLMRLRPRLVGTGDANEPVADPEDPSFSPTMGEGFVEGMTLLQAYPLPTIGLAMIIEGAYYLVNKRKMDVEQSKKPLLPIPAAVSSVGTAISQKIWNGITNNVDSYEDEGEYMGGERSAPASPSGSTTTFPTSASMAASKWRQYAESFKDSDTAASLSKASTNLTVVAIDAWKNKASTTTTPQSPPADVPVALPTTPAAPIAPVGVKLRQYAEAFKSSDTAASLSKVSSNWTAAAIDRWNKPAVSSSLNPTSASNNAANANANANVNPASVPIPRSPETPIRRGSMTAWSGWGVKASNVLWGPKNAESASHLGHTPSASMSEPGVRNWGSPTREARSSLPVPLPQRSREPSPSTPGRPLPSPTRSNHSGAESNPSSPYSPPPRPLHFAKPRDSLSGYPDRPRLDVSDPLLEALISTQQHETMSPEENSGGMLGSIQSALASFSNSSPRSRDPSPPSLPKPAPRPLLLGTTAAKNASPGPRSAAPGNGKSADSRPSSVSSNASVHAYTHRSVASITSPASAVPASASAAIGSRPWSSSPRTPSDSEGGFIPLRNGVGVGVTRPTSSAALVRKSRAAHATPRHGSHTRVASEYQAFEVPRPDSPSTVSSPPAPDTPPTRATTKLPATAKLNSPTELLPPKKWSLTDKPVLAIETPHSPANDGYSSMDSNPAKKAKNLRVRSKRNYQPKTGQLRVATSHRQPVDEFGMGAGLYPDERQFSDGPLTPRGAAIADDQLKTPTSGIMDHASIVSPIRPMKSPRRAKKAALPKEEKAPSPIAAPAPISGIHSEEEGAKADDEEGYEYLLDAYSEDDEGGNRLSAYAI